MRIGSHDITQKALIIAEIGGNHNGRFETAVELVKKAADSGVDAVKFQVYRAEGIVVREAPSHVPALTGGMSQFERYRGLELTKRQYQDLAALASKAKVIFLASVFDEECADMVEELVPAFKIASCDVTNLPLIRYIARKGKPVILSTGMASVDEITRAIKEIPADRLILLHCISQYPAPIESANLRTIPFLRDRFGVPVGYSDHTLGNTACLAAVALGAVIIEKHFTLDKSQPVGDHRLSLEPPEMRKLVDHIRSVETALGVYGKKISKAEMETGKLARRSLVAKKDILQGTTLTGDMLVPLRPAIGIPPDRIDEVVGKQAARNIKAGQPLTEEDIRW